MAHVDALSRVVAYIEPTSLERSFELKQLLNPLSLFRRTWNSRITKNSS